MGKASARQAAGHWKRESPKIALVPHTNPTVYTAGFGIEVRVMPEDHAGMLQSSTTACRLPI